MRAGAMSYMTRHCRPAGLWTARCAPSWRRLPQRAASICGSFSVGLRSFQARDGQLASSSSSYCGARAAAARSGPCRGRWRTYNWMDASPPFLKESLPQLKVLQPNRPLCCPFKRGSRPSNL